MEELVRQFHEKCKLPIGTPLSSAKFSHQQRVSLLRLQGQLYRASEIFYLGERNRVSGELTFRVALILEELRELLEELSFGNRERILKETADLLYVIVGFCVAFGLPIDEAFRRVHASNMTKDSASPRLKGPSYVPADLSGL